MITKNAENKLKERMYYGAGGCDKSFTYVNVNGVTETTKINTANSIYFEKSDSVDMTKRDTSTMSSGTSGEWYTIGVGNGTTQPTKNDYFLESPITNLHMLSLTQQIYNNESIIYIATYKNETEEDITVTEIGLFNKFMTFSSTSASRISSTYKMFIRDVIEPVTVKPNEVVSFTMTFN